MKHLLYCTVLFLLLSTSPCFGGNYNYTWIDEQGTTNITDFPPPDNVEILDVSPIPEVNRPSYASQELAKSKADAEKRSQLREQAAQKRQEETAARLRASELISEAEELRSRSAIHKVKRKYRRWANAMEDEAEALLSKADSLGSEAAKLEQQEGDSK